jgi:hypothetical protein
MSVFFQVYVLFIKNQPVEKKKAAGFPPPPAAWTVIVTVAVFQSLDSKLALLLGAYWNQAMRQTARFYDTTIKAACGPSR